LGGSEGFTGKSDGFGSDMMLQVDFDDNNVGGLRIVYSLGSSLKWTSLKGSRLWGKGGRWAYLLCVAQTLDTKRKSPKGISFTARIGPITSGRSNVNAGC